MEKRLSHRDRHLSASTQQLFAFIGDLCGSLLPAQRKRRIKTVELCCFGVWTHICHRKSHLMEAPPPTPAQSHVPRCRLIARYKFASLKMEEEEEAREMAFYPFFSCLHCSEKQTIYFDALHSRRHATTFSTAPWLNARLFHVCEDRRRKRNFY